MITLIQCFYVRDSAKNLTYIISINSSYNSVTDTLLSTLFPVTDKETMVQKSNQGKSYTI